MAPLLFQHVATNHEVLKMSATENDKLVAVKKVAEFHDCSVATVWRHVADGTIPK